MLNLDHYVGRRVESVFKGRKHKDDPTPEWSIRLEGGVSIHVFDPAMQKPIGLEGLALQMVTLSSPTTVIYFGTTQNPRQAAVHVHGMNYGITDDTQRDLGMVYPQRSEANVGDFPADPSPERAAESPDDDWYAEEHRRQQALAAEEDEEASSEATGDDLTPDDDED